MARRVIAIEGKPSLIPDTWLEKGSLRLDKGKKIPVTWSFDYTDVLGVAEHLERDEDTGEVSVEVTFRKEFNLDEEAFDYTFAANRLVETRVEETEEIPAHRIILQAHLIQIALTSSYAGFPKAAVSQELQGS